MASIFDKSNLNLIVDYMVQTVPYSEEGRKSITREIEKKLRTIFQIVLVKKLEGRDAVSCFDLERRARERNLICYGDLQREHIGKSQTHILSGAAGLGNNLCVIAPDILETRIMSDLVADRFSHICLVGGALDSLTNCARAIPLKKPVDLCCCDLTGFFKKTEDFLRSSSQRRLSAEAATREFNQGVLEFSNTVPLTEEISSIPQADYTISSLVMSQLPGLHLLFFSEKVRKYWPGNETILMHSYEKICSIFETNHLIFLYKITKDHGRIYLSDTTRGISIGRDLPRDTKRVLHYLFTVVAEDSWSWQPDADRTMTVRQFILQKKLGLTEDQLLAIPKLIGM